MRWIVGTRFTVTENVQDAVRLRPSVTLQVLPSAATRRAVDGSGLTILAFGDLGEPDIAFVEHALGSVRIEKEADVARARLGFDRLRSDALSPSDTRALLDGLAAG